MSAILDRPVPAWAKLVAQYKGYLVPLGFISLLVVIIVPLPPVIMDVLIAMNISIAVITLLTTVYISSVLEFSVFPALLLGTTLFRLVLNIASTRLILTADANSPQEAVGVAGKVISAFGSFVAGDSVIVGSIIFLILIIVQFVVITKGATRISEVAARFTLDAMPGKQMAIDADLNAGIIDENEARDRREKIQQEADFFGAMDGASKFVRGDATAGIIITVVNIIGGFSIGAIHKGWSLGETVEVFTRLTIGDGLVSQVPSFILAIAAGLVVTRTGATDALGDEMADQLAAKPIALILAASFLAMLAFTPLPALPLLGVAITLAGIAFFMTRTQRAIASQAQAQAQQQAATQANAEAPEVDKLLKLDTMELEIGYGLVAIVDANSGGDLLDRISAIRRQLTVELGLVMPPVRIRDNMSLEPNQYRVKIKGNAVEEGTVYPTKLLAMDPGVATDEIEGIPTREPAFGLNAWWIEPAQRDRAESLNYTVVDPTSVLATHITEIVKKHAQELLTREEVSNLIENLKERAPRLVEDVVPEIVKLGDLQKVLQNLLRERVPIRDLETIIETLADWSPRTPDLDILTEYTRNALKRTITLQHAVPSEVSADGSRQTDRIICVTIDPALEDVINSYVDRTANATNLAMPASVATRIASKILESLKPVMGAGHQPVILASPQVRAIVRQIIEPHLPSAAVLGYNEIVPSIEVESMALVAPPEGLGQPAVA
ncbi:MAG: flagellar biosynthesis protein FlhA [Planctomycetota bacterium]|jgi:flagellar biosynthesis protein FlhA